MKKSPFQGFAFIAGMAGAATAMAADTVRAAPGQSVTFVDPLAGSTLTPGGGGDLSPLGMFMSADAVVQSVIVLLLLASFITWVIGAAKWFQLKAERRQLAAGMRDLNGAAELAAIGQTAYPPIAEMVVQAEDEMAASGRHGMAVAPEGIKDRIAARLERLSAGLRRDAGRSVGALAIVSTTAPFVGLFGTVWGIMNSFVSIAHSHSTSLAVVAPGIAEALLTTAVGLVAAIPAAILYNVFSRILSNYAGELGDASVAVLCIAGREVDQARAGG